LSLKNEIFNSIRKRAKSNNPLKASDINDQFIGKNIYINHYLTLYNKKLLWLSKLLLKAYNFSYAWAICYGVFIKKSEGDASIKINIIKQLNVLDNKKMVPQLWSES